MAESSQNGQKTLWKKDKLLVTSNFSFSRSVFKILLLQTRKNWACFGKASNWSFRRFVECTGCPLEVNNNVCITAIREFETYELLRCYPYKEARD